jgi:hypothetical protein
MANQSKTELTPGLPLRQFVDFMLKHELLSILLRILANPTHSHRFRVRLPHPPPQSLHHLPQQSRSLQEVIVGVLGNVGSVRSRFVPHHRAH